MLRAKIKQTRKWECEKTEHIQLIHHHQENSQWKTWLKTLGFEGDRLGLPQETAVQSQKRRHLPPLYHPPCMNNAPPTAVNCMLARVGGLDKTEGAS